MFSFFKRKPKEPTPAPATAPATAPEPVQPAPNAAPSAPAAPDVAGPAAASSQAAAHTASQAAVPAPSAQISAGAPAVTADADIVKAPVADPAAAAAKKTSWLGRLKAGLSRTSSGIATLFTGTKIDEDLYDELEAALLMADAGVDATQYLLDALKAKVKQEKLVEAAQVKAALRAQMIELLRPLEKPLVLGREQPLVMMIAGVNGAGKTTTIGKLAKHMQAHGQKVLLAAGDTFRAAAREQLTIWGQRNGVDVIAQESGDPAAVAFDAVQAGRARGADVVMIDTAGRLPTQLHLMDELKKVRRVIGKAIDTAPHEVLLIIDGNTGQNALAQVKAFDDALTLTGLVVTKLDGTAKGGVLAAIVKQRSVPVYFIGVGEGIDDLQPFVAEEFVDALLG